MSAAYPPFAVAMLLVGAPVVATGGQGEVRLGAVEMFDLATRAVAEGRPDEALRLYDALGKDPEIDIRSEARFRKGQLLAAQGRLREAALVWRRLLDEKPDAARVRLDLASLLARMGDEAGARRQLRLAQAVGLPSEIAQQVSQFAQSLRSPQRAGATFDLALAPDSNVNRGTQARTLDTVIAPLLLSRDARETSGLGVRLRGSGFVKQPVDERLALVVRAAGSADLYRGGDANDWLASVQAGMEWRGPREQFGLSYGVTRRWYGGTALADTHGLSGEWLRQLGGRAQLSLNVSRLAIRYRRNPLQDGLLYDTNVSVERALSPRSGIAIGIAPVRQTARDPSYASSAIGPLVYGWHDWGRTTLFATAIGRRLIGDERNFLFTDRRKETFVSGRIGAVLRRFSFHGLSPTVRAGYERNYSTVSIYAYRRFYGEVGLSRSF